MNTQMDEETLRRFLDPMNSPVIVQNMSYLPLYWAIEHCLFGS